MRAQTTTDVHVCGSKTASSPESPAGGSLVLSTGHNYHHCALLSIPDQAFLVSCDAHSTDDEELFA